MAELADAQSSNLCAARREGSNPSFRIRGVPELGRPRPIWLFGSTMKRDKGLKGLGKAPPGPPQMTEWRNR